MSNSLKLEICVISSFVESKSYKSTLFRDWKWKICLPDSRPRKKQTNVSHIMARGLCYLHSGRGRDEIMASLLKMVTTPKGLSTNALYNIFYCLSSPVACYRKQAIQRDVLRQSPMFDGYSALCKLSCSLP